MKRSVAVSLVIMGTAAGLAGCEPEKFVDTAVWETVEQCGASSQFTLESCQKNFEAAKVEHSKNAPAYAKKADCEAEFGEGKCDEQTTAQHSAGSNFFMPYMMGYMMGGRSVDASPAVAPAQALYKQTGKSNFVNAGGASIASAPGKVRVGNYSPAFKAPSGKTTTLSRGGFGARAVSVSS